ncbi:MAG: hypothetical protein M1826_007608 [Phylliscum demangeonii]|nr:MAG: hypothetical protein M1826_007608 [Phylliscum demangeonii]
MHTATTMTDPVEGWPVLSKKMALDDLEDVSALSTTEDVTTARTSLPFPPPEISSLPPLPESPSLSSVAIEAHSSTETLEARSKIEKAREGWPARPSRLPDTGIAGDSPPPDDHPNAGSESDSERGNRRRSDSSGTQMSLRSNGVDWDELERNEEQEAREEGSDESTALLLAWLERENDALVTDPKSSLTKPRQPRSTRYRRQTRPPSIHFLKSLVDGPAPPSLRYSLLPSPPPMTDLEFYAALVADYPRTAHCLPTLLSRKVRSGIPPPLRGVVWVSMAGAHDQLLEEQFEQLSGESSPYENIIDKDIGRSFPTIDMFKDPDGEGQRKLARVLKCFSLYDQEIGYCQGLSFLVGPLLMHMDDRDSFCILVRLMEHYDLRACFLPDLSGLHLRIYQFRHLLAQHLPKVAARLEELQVDPAFVSQWFLSFFAVTCPLPMLLRVYDVIFAEGASETLMRVALALMRRNQAKILACSELDDVMQLLLSRAVWDVYRFDGDVFVADFVEMTSAVARDGLQALETGFTDAQREGAHAKLVSQPDLQSTASRFLGRFWAGSPALVKPISRSPTTASSSPPSSLLHRSPSKQSLSSTVNSSEIGSDGGRNSATTDATTMSRQLSGDCLGSKLGMAAIGAPTTTIPSASSARPARSQERDLHGQIEDLLTALSEMQKSQVALGEELRSERDGRETDAQVVGRLLAYLKEPVNVPLPEESQDEALVSPDDSSNPATGSTRDLLPRLVHAVEQQLVRRVPVEQILRPAADNSPSEHNRLMVQYEEETTKSQHLLRRLEEQETELAQVRDQLKESRARIHDSHRERQRLEATMKDLRRTAAPPSSGNAALPNANHPEMGIRRSSTYGSGLREFKLNKSPTVPSATFSTPTYAKRTSSLSAQSTPTLGAEKSPLASPAVPHDDILLQELVRAKTAEAMAKQEAEELRSKLEFLRKMPDQHPLRFQLRLERRATCSAP